MNNIIKTIKNKISARLQKDSGATIIFALVVFLVAAIISTTIVNVAMTNLSRSASRKSNEQARLAVVSAAGYLESNKTELKNALVAIAASDEVWTISVSGDDKANSALGATVTWTEVDRVEDATTALTAQISSGSYKAEIRLIYDTATDTWGVSRFKKI